ncbi:MAG: IclR family transcriptional regulator [Actinomycetota bacterium]
MLDRSVAILDAVDRGARTLAEVVAATGLSRTTAHRLLQAMERHALLGHDRGTGYRLGAHLARLSTGSLRSMPWRKLARGSLTRLAAVTGESAQLYVREGDVRVCVEAVESTNELRTIVPVGARLPLTAGSAGKVFLAWASPADRERLVDGAPAVTRRTPTGGTLMRDLATVRRRGWASSAGEREDGVGSVSAPALAPDGEPLAVVSISGPISRVGGAAAGPQLLAVRAAAREIEAAVRA